MTLPMTVKQEVVAEVNEVAAKSSSAVVAAYSGLTVNQMTELRAKARNSNVYLRVVKNTLTRKAIENTSFSCLSDSLKGPLFIAFSQDSPSDAARLLKEFAKTNEQLKIKALAVDGQLYSANQLDIVASLPTREEALSKLMYVMKAPIEKFVRTLAAPQGKLVRTIAAIKDTKAG